MIFINNALLINNELQIRYIDKSFSDNGKKKRVKDFILVDLVKNKMYGSVSKKDYTQEINEYLEDLIENEHDDIFFKYIADKQVRRTVNPYLNLVCLKTPLYSMYCRLATGYATEGNLEILDITSDPDKIKTVNLTYQWIKIHLKFLSQEIIKFSKLSPLMINKLAMSVKIFALNRAARLKHNNTLLLIPVNYTTNDIFNPFILFDPSLKIIRGIRGEMEIESFNDPFIFNIILKNTELAICAGTQTDILQLCGVSAKCKRYSAEELIKIMGAILLNSIGATSDDTTDLPINQQVYVYHPSEYARQPLVDAIRSGNDNLKLIFSTEEQALAKAVKYGDGTASITTEALDVYYLGQDALAIRGGNPQ